MSIQSVIDQPERGNPFRHIRNYSAAAVELMRALSAHRRATQQETLSPAQVLQVVNSLGYYPPQQDNRPAYQELLDASRQSCGQRKAGHCKPPQHAVVHLTDQSTIDFQHSWRVSAEQWRLPRCQSWGSGKGYSQLRSYQR